MSPFKRKKAMGVGRNKRTLIRGEKKMQQNKKKKSITGIGSCTTENGLELGS